MMKPPPYLRDFTPVLPFVKPYWRIIIYSLICTVLYALSNVYIMPLVNDISRELSNNNFKHFTNHIVNASLLFFVRLTVKYIQTYIMEKASYQMMLDIRYKLYQIIHYLPTDVYQTQKHGDITSRILDDCDKIRRAILLNFESLLPNALTIIGVIGYLFYLNWPLALLSLVGAPIFVITLNYFSKKLRKVSRQLQQTTANFTQMIQESLINMKVIQIYNRESHNIRQFHVAQTRYIRGYLKEIRIKITREQIDAYSQYLIFLMIFWFGGYLSLQGVITGSELLAFFMGIILLVEPVIILTKVYAETFQVKASVDRVAYLLDFDPLDVPVNASPPLTYGDLCFDRVGFKYPSSHDHVLNDVSFTVKDGDMLGIVGPSGAGKSTIVNLITKFYDPNSGHIRVDGQSIIDVSAHDWRRHIAIVPQESLLFKSTILDNCRFGRPDASIDEVIEALKLAHAWEFVSDLPDQLLTKIGTQGLTLSGGQRQRLSIARAILSRPKLLILDEATSALDSQSEAQVQSAIKSLKGTFTMIVIAHRLSTIQDATNILVLDKGRVIGEGTHQTLMTSNDLYKGLVQKQSMNPNKLG